MRAKGGYKKIIDAIQKMEKVHKEHIAVYGTGKEERLTGKHETADITTSIRIPRQTELDKRGYFEDRRPAANCDPYLVTSMIAKTTLLLQLYPMEDVEKLIQNGDLDETALKPQSVQ